MKKLLLSALILSFASISHAEFSPKKTECIAPAGAGGGWDFTCRIPAAKIMKELKLIPGTMKVTNISGGGGGKAYATVAGKLSKKNNVIVAASMATATRLGQNLYSGYSANDVRWVGSVGADFAVIAVSDDSKYKTLKDLMDDIKKGTKVKIAGASSAGGWDHLKFLMVADKAGITDLKNVGYISFTEGSTALLEVIGKRIEVFSGDTSEIIEYLNTGKIRILAVSSPNKIKALGDTPTTKESGYDVIAANWRGFYMPKKSSDEAYNYWVNSVKKVANSNEWKILRDKNGLVEFSSFGNDFETFVKDQIKTAEELSKKIGLLK